MIRTARLEPVSPRRRRLIRRGAPLVLAGVALAAGGVGTWVARPASEGEQAVGRWVAAWAAGDYPAMYEELSPGARERFGRAEVGRAHRRANATATLREVRAVRLRRRDDVVEADLLLSTRVFGDLERTLRVPLEAERVAWRPSLVFPGLRDGTRLRRTSDVPRRAAILARDGRTLAEGAAELRTPGEDGLGAGIAGVLGPAPTERERRRRYAMGFRADTWIGLNGLERVLERQVAGRPGGVLVSGSRVLASSPPRPAPPVRTSIDPGVQAAAVSALAGRLGGVAAVDALTAEVRALAGLAFSAPQPPGSTFKIITATAALEDGLARASTRFPVQTKAVLEGVPLENANGERCGGTFVEAFAHSCNSVFAPLGVRVGARRLADAARRYGWGERPPLAGARPATMPAPEAIGGPLALGSTAIGQGKVLATPLTMALVAHTVAAGGLRRTPTVTGGPGRARRVTSPAVARTLERMMVRVVQEGTGTRASLHPVRVAGKTGTAELEDTTPEGEPAPASEEPPGYRTNAWFTAYAPLRTPRLAVAVMLVRGGAGGDTAAPAARLVLEAGLRGREGGGQD